MYSPALVGPSDPDAEFRRLLRGYGLALLFVVGVHIAGWLWTRPQPVETPVVIPPMVDVELIAPPRQASADQPAAAPAPAAAPPAAKSVPKKTETAAKPKPKPKPPPKPVDMPRPVKEPAPAKPVEDAEATRPVAKPVPAPAASEAASAGSSARPSTGSRDAGQGSSAKGAGGGEQKVTPAHDAGYLHNPKPRYPPIAIARNWEGLVRLRVYVLPNGTPGQVVLQQSSGHDALDQAALEVVQRWRFVPAKRGEQAIASWVVVPLVFKLDSGR